MKVRFKLKQGKYLYIVASWNGGKIDRSTGIQVEDKYWDAKAYRIKKSYTRATTLNVIINNLKTGLPYLYDDLIAKGRVEDIEKEAINLILETTGKKKSSKVPSLAEFIKQNIENHKRLIALGQNPKGNWKEWQKTVNRLEGFSQFTGRNVNYQNIDWEFLQRFAEWCYSPPRKYSITTASRSVQVICFMMKKAYRLGYHTNQIYLDTDFNIKKPKVKDKPRLTLQQVRKLAEYDFKEPAKEYYMQRFGRAKKLHLSSNGKKSICGHRLEPENAIDRIIWDDGLPAYLSGKGIQDWDKTKCERCEELAIISQKNTRLEQVRDLAMAVIFSGGLRVSDWHKLQNPTIKNRNGRKYIELTTQKTKTPVLLPVLPEFESILNKYNGNIPVMSGQKFSAYFKEVLEIVLPNATYNRIYSKAGQVFYEEKLIWEKASSHVLRHTFASVFYELTGEIELIGRILGHSDRKTTELYLNIDLNNMLDRFFIKAQSAMKEIDKKVKRMG